MLRCLRRIFLQAIIQVLSFHTSSLSFFLSLQPYLIILFEERDHHSRFLQRLIHHLFKTRRKLHLLHDQQHLLFLTILLTINLSPVKLSNTYQDVLEVLQPILARILFNLQQIKEDKVSHRLIDKFRANFKFSEEGMKMLEGLFWIFLMHSCALYILEVSLT